MPPVRKGLRAFFTAAFGLSGELTKRPSGRLEVMGRANQLGSGGIFHITHRCHNRALLLKFAYDRDGYRAILREQLKRFEGSIWRRPGVANFFDIVLSTEFGE